MLIYLFLGITYASAAAVQPGPFQTYLISQTLSHGWRSTLPAAFAPLLSDGPIILLVLLVLYRMPDWLAMSLQCVGGIFLLYLAIGAFKAWRTYQNNNAYEKMTSQQTVLKAALVNLLNPNPWLAWSLVLGPLLLKGWRENPVHGLSLLIGFYSAMILVTLGIILLFAFARNLGPIVSRTLIGISAIAMASFGLYEIRQGLHVVIT
jgi:threonine/homoserine/homoserine lactone efflux protein